MWNKFKSFYNKDEFNFSTGYVDPFEFHLIVYKVLVAFKVTDLNNPSPPSIFNQNAVLFVDGLIGLLMTSISCYHGLATYDIPFMTEAGTYCLVLSHLLLVLYCTRTNLKQYHNLLRAMKEDFHNICTVGNKYRVKYFENQLKTWKICVCMWIFNVAIPMGMVTVSFLALLYFLITYDETVGGSRPLLFPFRMFDIDFSKSPTYECAFIYANVTVFLFAYGYIFMSLTQILWIRQIASKADIIIWSLQDLLVDIYPATTQEEEAHFTYLIQTRMRDIVIHHQSMYSLLEDYAAVYKKILLFEQSISGPLVCLSAYCVAEKFENGDFQVILLLMTIAVITLYFIPSLLCTYLVVKVRSVYGACWDIPFWNASSVIRPYLVIIMQRAIQPLPLQSPGFKEVSLETFSQNMTTAYSLFNMLRQTKL